MVVFSNIQQKHILDVGQLFASSHVWIFPHSVEKNYRDKGHLFQQNLTLIIHIF